MLAVRTDHDDEQFFEDLQTVRREQNVKWKAGLKIFVALALIFEAQSRLSAYVLQEALTVVLGIAILHLLMLVTVIAFLLLWHGAIFVFLRLTRIVDRIISVRDRPLASDRC